MVMSAASLSLRDKLSSALDTKEDGLEIEKRVSDCNFMGNKNNSCDINIPKHVSNPGTRISVHKQGFKMV